MDELEAIRKKKLEALQNQQAEQSQEHQAQEQLQQLEGMVKQVFTKKALERYGNIKTAFPERATQIIVLLSQAIQSGQLTQVDDNTLKEILKKITPKKKDIKITRV
ncbi:hypothetical protein ISS07_00260 [Candidatus Woesearchaeota archaeon]|nr:hypothetical protein [Candidatus Woesearchaeota archaeon]